MGENGVKVLLKHLQQICSVHNKLTVYALFSNPPNLCHASHAKPTVDHALNSKCRIILRMRVECLAAPSRPSPVSRLFHGGCTSS